MKEKRNNKKRRNEFERKTATEAEERTLRTGFIVQT
jgi:hypothetical protein